MFELVGDLRQKKRGPGFKFGATRWREIKDQLRRPTDPQLVLQDPCPPEPISQELLKAVIACKGNHPDRSLLQCFIRTFGVPNKTTLRGIFELAPSMNPRMNKQLGCCVDICRWIARTDLKRHFAPEFDLMTSFIDTTLKCAFEKGKLKPLQFTSLHRPLCELLLPANDLHAIVGSDEKWGTVLEQLHRVIDSSTVGGHLFNFAILKELSNAVGNAIMTKVDMLFNSKVTRDTVDALRAKILADVGTLSNIGLLPPKRVVDLHYMAGVYAAKVN